MCANGSAISAGPERSRGMRLRQSHLRHLSRLAVGLLHIARCLGGSNARAACSTSPRVRGEVDLQAEPLRSEANRVRGLVHRLRLAETPPHPDSFASPGI